MRTRSSSCGVAYPGAAAAAHEGRHRISGMKDWAAGLTILSVAFVGTVVVTIGLAAVIVPTAVGPRSSVDPAASPVTVDMTPQPVDQRPEAIGGVLTVTGDVEGTLLLDREDAEIGFVFDDDLGLALLEDGPYQLAGDDGRVVFDVEPLVVEQVDYAGLSFYPEPDQCHVTPGVLNPVLGVATAGLRCVEIADIRDNGVVTIDGTIMAAGDVLGMRGELPPSGGTLAVGSTTVEFPAARMLLEPFGFDAATGLANLPLFTPDQESGLIVEYDPQTHELAIGDVVVDGESAELAPGSCSVARSDIGLLNPRTSVVELRVACDSVDLPALGSVPVDGTLVVDLIGVDAPP